jgi:uncharacterized protein (TIGR03086 family)
MTFPVLTDSLRLLHDAAAGVSADQLDDRTPCPEWTVAQVLFHAAGDQIGWASSIGSGAPPAYDPFNPPQRLDTSALDVVDAAVAVATAAWARLDPTADSVRTPLPPTPTLAPHLAAAACALDAAIHAWDVAVATGRPSPLTPDLAEQLLPAARATAEPLRGFAYAPALPAEPGGDAVSTLLRYLGRHPHWTR